MKNIFVFAITLALLCSGLASEAVVTERVSVDSSGAAGDGWSFIPNMSANGHYICYTSAPPDGTFAGIWDVFVFDRGTGTRTTVSTSATGEMANDTSLLGVISANGRYVVFASFATNLVPGVTNGECQFYRKDLQTGSIICVSTSSAGVPGSDGHELGTVPLPSVSGDGRYACFSTQAGNLVNGDTNGEEDCFVKDCDTGTIWRVSTETGGGQIPAGWQPAISPDAQFVIFGRDDQIYLKDRLTDTTACVSLSTGGAQGNADSDFNPLASFSADNRFVVFYSEASNLVAEDTNGVGDVFVRDTSLNSTVRVSTSSSGAQANGKSLQSSISSDGRYVTFSSDATNLVEGDTNDSRDVFVKDLLTGETRLLSRVTGGGPKPPYNEWEWGCIGVFDGRYCIWSSGADGIVPGPKGGPNHIYFSDFQADTVVGAKALPDDSPVVTSGGVVTAAFDGAFYLQQDGISSRQRISGISVEWPGAVDPGKRYVVSGAMRTNPDGERYIEAEAVDSHTSEWTIDAQPIGISGKTLGGGNFGYIGQTGEGQRGVTNAAGVNNIGLLVRTIGACTYVNPHTFLLDDLSRVSVTCETPSTILVSPAWEYVAVTGISSMRKSGETYERLIRVTAVDPIVSAQPEGITGRWEMTTTSGDLAGGVFGMLLVQDGNDVNGRMWKNEIDSGQMNGQVFTGTFFIEGYNITIESYLTLDGDTLSGTWTVPGEGVYEVTFDKLSPDPISPYIGRPKVVSATCDGQSIDITWDRPINGWDYAIHNDLGQSIVDNWDLYTSYDPDTYTYHIALDPSTPFEPGAHYTIYLDMPDDSDVVDWHDPYGVAAWQSESDAYSFEFVYQPLAPINQLTTRSNQWDALIAWLQPTNRWRDLR